MSISGHHRKAVVQDSHKNRCLSCGTAENMSRRKYCSIECRQRLRYHLNIRTGLLRALNTRYATFYFTESVIILDVLPYGSPELFSYMFPRTLGLKPVDDFCTISNILGNAWWNERRRTNKRYLASRHVLERAKSKDAESASIKPLELKEPVRLAKILNFSKNETRGFKFGATPEKNKDRLSQAGHGIPPGCGR